MMKTHPFDIYTQLSSLLQVDATYKLTWNELPLSVSGSSDADRHFRSFGVALVSSDEGSACYIDLFKQLKLISGQENQREYIVHYVMTDGAPGITRVQKEIFPQARRLMCWAHVVRKCREHRKLVPTDKGNKLILIYMIYNYVFPIIYLLTQYFFDQWIDKLPLWYEGAALNMPLTNNGCESLHSTI
ncbi:unnamed protein product [Rotaria socialis]|uniref:MULE transposase domain-containing protein n=1 Tax=Rotaria socialis TaxID=392032 RepID=A0A820QLZ7_9BILA|nr:unnamed protein product [Rotaria socialis]CAF4425033.1 unnamed protein product [Rotaria socialis]